MSIAAVVLIPICGAAIPFLLRRSRHTACAAGAAIVSMAALVLLATQAPIVWNQQTAHSAIEWIPQLGLRFLPTVSTVLCDADPGNGSARHPLARFYLDSSEPFGRFYAVLLLPSRMLTAWGTTLLMLVFWETLPVPLIGHWSHRAESRQGAHGVDRHRRWRPGTRCMLLIGNIAGSYEVSEIIERGETPRASPLAPVALALIRSASVGAIVPFGCPTPWRRRRFRRICTLPPW